MSDRKNFCSAPWSHLMVYASGEISTCWSSHPLVVEQRNLGHLQTDDIEQICNSKNAKEVRKAFLNGQIPLQCHDCFRLESHNIPSDRLANFNFDYINLEEKIQNTKADGSIDPSEINSLELMLSNVCNFTCRTCNVGSSSAWANEHQFIYKTKVENAVRRPFPNPDDTATKVFNLAPNLKRLSFIGGEPLIQAEHLKLLNMLIDHGRTDMKLCYTTNLSELKFRDQDLIELWKKFDEIYLTISLDGLKEKGEYIRKGFIWEKFQENLERISRELTNVTLSCNITASVLNILDMGEIVDYVLAKGFSPSKVKLSPVKYPMAYSITILPEAVKEKIKTKYGSYKSQPHIDEQIQGVLNYMFSHDNSDKLPQFFALNDRLDLLRGETTQSIHELISEIHRN